MEAQASLANLLEGEKLEISTQTLKGLNLIPEKNKSSKTMFKLPEFAFEFINRLSKIEGIDTVREAIEMIVKRGIEDHKREDLPLVELPQNAIRKSVNISENSKKILEELAKSENISRDAAFLSCIWNMAYIISKRPASTSEKIKCAKVLLNMSRKMLDIYYSPEAEEARKTLWASNDSDFGTMDDAHSCGDLLGYVECLNELPFALENFIKAKEAENETDQTCAD